MALEDDTFSDSDSSSSGDAFTGAFIGSSLGSSNYGHGRNHNNGSGWALLIILVVFLVVIVVATSGDNSHGERRAQQIDAMIKAWAQSMDMTVASENGKPGYSCQHEKSRALCDVRLTNGERRHLSCGKGGCSER